MNGTKADERSLVVSRLLPGLQGPAREVVVKWDAAEFQVANGCEIFLDKLARSPLVRRAIPDANAMLDKYLGELKRRGGESMAAFLVREDTVHENFVEALERLVEQRRDRNRRARVEDDLNALDEEAEGDHVDEEDEVDRFEVFVGVIRGWRLLRATGLDARERNAIMAATQNSIEYMSVADALQNQWEEADLAERDRRLGIGAGGGKGRFKGGGKGKGGKGKYGNSLDAAWDDNEGQDTAPDWHGGYAATWDDSWWDDGWHTHAAMAAFERACEKAYEDGLGQATGLAADGELREILETEKTAESMLTEATRTLTQARQAVQAAKRDRGFGQVQAGKRKGKGRFLEAKAAVEGDWLWVRLGLPGSAPVFGSPGRAVA